MWLCARDHRSRLIAFVLCCVVALSLVAGFTGPQAARAQEPPAAGEAEKAEQPRPSTNLFIHIIKSMGPVFGLVFGFISVGMLALIVLLAMDLRMGSAIPPTFVEDFTDTVNKRRFKEAYDLARQDNSFLARVLSTGMSRLQYGIEDAREAALNMVESIKSSKEQLLTYLGTVGTLGPLIGLVGTVFGMILAFMELAGSEGRPNFIKLVGSISHALVITMVGVALAVPAIFCHAFFRNRLIRITNDTSNLADDLLTQMYHNSKRPAAPVSAPVAAPHDTRSSTAAIKTAE
jgi:biopolymer transport protein ExbB